MSLEPFVTGFCNCIKLNSNLNFFWKISTSMSFFLSTKAAHEDTQIFALPREPTNSSHVDSFANDLLSKLYNNPHLCNDKDLFMESMFEVTNSIITNRNGRSSRSRSRSPPKRANSPTSTSSKKPTRAKSTRTHPPPSSNYSSTTINKNMTYPIMSNITTPNVIPNHHLSPLDKNNTGKTAASFAEVRRQKIEAIERARKAEVGKLVSFQNESRQLGFVRGPPSEEEEDEDEYSEEGSSSSDDETLPSYSSKSVNDNFRRNNELVNDASLESLFDEKSIGMLREVFAASSEDEDEGGKDYSSCKTIRGSLLHHQGVRSGLGVVVVGDACDKLKGMGNDLIGWGGFLGLLIKGKADSIEMLSERVKCHDVAMSLDLSGFKVKV